MRFTVNICNICKNSINECWLYSFRELYIGQSCEWNLKFAIGIGRNFAIAACLAAVL